MASLRRTAALISLAASVGCAPATTPARARDDDPSTRRQGLTLLAGDAPRPIAWCDAPSEHPIWARQRVYLTISKNQMPGGTQYAPPDQGITTLLSVLSAAFARRTGLSDSTGAALKPAEPRYGPAALMSHISFGVSTDGRLVVPLDESVGDSTFLADLTAAMLDADSAGAFHASAPEAQPVRMLLATSTDFGAPGRRPVFSMYAPRARSVEPRQDNQPMEYPEGPRNWKARVLLEFVVDADGAVHPGSIRSLVNPDLASFPSPDVAEAYRRFVKATVQQLATWRYRPAEFAGCRIGQLVQQEFNFSAQP
jgi:hypothetical protein